MDLRNETKIVLWTAGILLLVAVICYAAFPVRTPQPPLRLMLFNTAGPVLFDHHEHTAVDRYGYACMDCHHTMESPDEVPEACGECHEADSEDLPKRSDAFHQQCISCHKQDGTAPVDCAACHQS